MRKFISVFLGLAAFLVFAVKPAMAFQKISYLSLIFPVRELTPSVQLPQTTTELVDSIYKQATPSATPITWVMQYDAVKSSTTSAFFNTLAADHTQELGLLLEVTPKLVTDANLQNTGAISLNNFPPAERTKLIDQAIQMFFQRFGYFPRSVEAPYIDSLSLQYLSQKYNVKTAIFTDDNSQIKTQGSLEFFPYFPSRLNALVPAQTPADKLTITVVHRNPVDLVDNSNLNLEKQIKLSSIKRGFEDTFDRFSQKDLNEFTDLNLGVSNDTPSKVYLPVFEQLLNAIQNSKAKDTLTPIKAGEFGEWFIEHYPYTSPAYFYNQRQDNQTTLWYTNPYYQAKLVSDGDKSRFSQLMIFNNHDTEDFRFDYNRENKLEFNYTSVSGADQNLIDINLNKAIFTNIYWQLIATDGAKMMHFDTHQISASGFSLPDQIINSFPSVNLLQYRLVKILLILLMLLLLFKFTPPQLKELLKKNKGSVLIILFGSFCQVITMFKSGSLTDYGLGFWGPNGHDAFVHLALIESFKHSFWPLVNPTLVNAPLFNYHILYDLLLAVVSKLTKISSLDLYFRIFPVILSLLLGVLSLWLLKQLKNKKGAIWLSLILVYFAGSWGFLIGRGESTFWATQAISLLINPPLTLSLVLLLVFFNLFTRWQNGLTWQRVFALSFLGGLLIQAKSYSAVLLIAALSITTAISFFRRLPNFKTLLALTGLTVFISVLLFLPTYQQSTSLFTFSPLWFIRSMIDSPDRLGWSQAARAWLAYENEHNMIKLALLQLVGIGIFYLGNLGLRVLGLKSIVKQAFSDNPVITLISWICILGLVVPLVFIQASNPWNSIQFMYYSLFFLVFFTSPVLYRLLINSNTIVRFGFIVLLIALLTVPTTLSTLKDYLSPTPATVISPSELKALELLNSLPNGYVLTPIFDESIARSFTEPKPNADYTSTAYVSALSGQRTYFSDEINLSISGYSYSNPLRDTQKVFKTSDYHWVNDFLTQNNVRYIYVTYPNHFTVDPKAAGVYPIFESPSITLYQHNL